MGKTMCSSLDAHGECREASLALAKFYLGMSSHDYLERYDYLDDYLWYI